MPGRRAWLRDGDGVLHPAKLDLIAEAQGHGFIVIVMHVGVADAALSLARVAARVGEGCHPVPEDKVRARMTGARR